MNRIETVDRDCPHTDCSYRRRLVTGYRGDYCDYIGATWHSRGCKISECDKYTTEPVIFSEDWH